MFLQQKRQNKWIRKEKIKEQKIFESTHKNEATQKLLFSHIFAEIVHIEMVDLTWVVPQNTKKHLKKYSLHQTEKEIPTFLNANLPKKALF
jgi:outer membrane protein W